MILSLDAGTTSMRGILYDDTGRAAFISRKETSPRFLEGNRVEQDPLVWKRGLERILSECGTCVKEKRLTLEGITLTAFRSPVFPVDSEGNALLPAIMWQDKRTDALCLEMADFSPQVYQSTGLPIHSVFSAVKMLWIQKNCPEAYRKTWKMAGIYDYLLYLLTGRFVTDYSVAGRMNLFDLAGMQWDESLLDLFSVKKEHLPDTVPPGSICGFLPDDLADRTGLASGIPVVTGGGDQQCAALGLGVFSPGQAAVNTGTGAYVIGLSDKPVLSSDRRTYCNAAAIPGKFILEASLSTAGTVYRWFCSTLGESGDGESSLFALLDKEIEASPPGAQGVLLIPSFKQDRASSSGFGIKGAFLNLDLQTRRGDMARAVLEGIAFELRTRLGEVERASGPIGHIAVSGGMTRFGQYNQIQADIFERPVTAWGDGEATALGAWMNAMIALGKASSYKGLWEKMERGRPEEYHPNPINLDIYRSARALRDQVCKALNIV